MSIKGVIFDLDGVIVSTDEFHYQGWQRLADQENIFFDRTMNDRLRGVSRMESLDIILEKANKSYSSAEKLKLAEAKNDIYRDLLKKISPSDILPGVASLLKELKAKNIKIAIGSSSRNSPTILAQIGLGTYFDATADGNDIKNSKPDPEVFLLAATLLGLEPAECLVVEDAEAGVQAGLAGGMKVLAVGAAASDPNATLRAPDMSHVSVEQLLSL
jgi:beta-phosphoglucomutase